MSLVRYLGSPNKLFSMLLKNLEDKLEQSLDLAYFY